jgi:ferredoxin--NADP+ reductase
VAWYNGHPDVADRTFDLRHERVVVVGNGNVALDVARILTVDPETLAGTDIAPAALRTLRASRVTEVMVIGRRGPCQSSFTLPELVGLSRTPGVELALEPGALDGTPANDPKLRLLHDLGTDHRDGRRIVLRYRLSPVRVLGRDRVEAVELERGELVGDDAQIRLTGEREMVATGLLLSSIGYRGRRVPDLPFDTATGTVPHERGRVVDSDSRAPVPGVFVAGWIKRGPTGFIGTNKSCAQETVRSLVDDFNAGLLAPRRARTPRMPERTSPSWPSRPSSRSARAPRRRFARVVSSDR